MSFARAGLTPTPTRGRQSRPGSAAARRGATPDDFWEQSDSRPGSSASGRGSSVPHQSAWNGNVPVPRKERGRFTPTARKASSVDETLFGTKTQTRGASTPTSARSDRTDRSDRSDRTVSTTRSRPGSAAGSRPGSAAGSRPPSGRSSAASSRSARAPRGGAGGGADSSRPPTGRPPNVVTRKRGVIRKGYSYVDETLFGGVATGHRGIPGASAEDRHRHMHSGGDDWDSIWAPKGEAVTLQVPRRTKAAASGRCDFTKKTLDEVSAPPGSQPESVKLKRTNTLAGGHGTSFAPPKPGPPPKTNPTFLHHPKQVYRHAPVDVKPPFVHDSGAKFKPTAAPAAKLTNTIWDSHPNL